MSRSSVLGQLFCYSVAMFTLPFATFFGTKYVFKTYFDVTGFANTVYSVILAVLMVNCIIFSYAYRAYHEHDHPVEESREKKKD